MLRNYPPKSIFAAWTNKRFILRSLSNYCWPLWVSHRVRHSNHWSRRCWSFGPQNYKSASRQSLRCHWTCHYWNRTLDFDCCSQRRRNCQKVHRCWMIEHQLKVGKRVWAWAVTNLNIIHTVRSAWAKSIRSEVVREGICVRLCTWLVKRERR